MIFNRIFEMPNKNTFEIPTVLNLIKKYKNGFSIDPFANKSKICDITNDLDKQYKTDYNLDAIEFLKIFENNSVDFILYDPPYTLRQVSESYKKLDMSVNMETTQSSYWSKQKNEISRVLKKDGICISFGYNSGGLGIERGCKIIEILLLNHGGSHYDTICTVERKVKTDNLKLF